MLSNISRCKFALSFGAFPGVLYRKHCNRKNWLRIVVSEHADSTDPTH